MPSIFCWLVTSSCKYTITWQECLQPCCISERSARKNASKGKSCIFVYAAKESGPMSLEHPSLDLMLPSAELALSAASHRSDLCRALQVISTRVICHRHQANNKESPLSNESYATLLHYWDLSRGEKHRSVNTPQIKTSAPLTSRAKLQRSLAEALWHTPGGPF